MPIERNTVDSDCFNPGIDLPCQLRKDDFRRNPRGELGTRTATLHAEGIRKLRESWIYKA